MLGCSLPLAPLFQETLKSHPTLHTHTQPSHPQTNNLKHPPTHPSHQPHPPHLLIRPGRPVPAAVALHPAPLDPLKVLRVLLHGAQRHACACGLVPFDVWGRVLRLGSRKHPRNKSTSPQTSASSTRAHTSAVHPRTHRWCG